MTYIIIIINTLFKESMSLTLPMIQKDYIYRPRTLCNMTTYNYHYERLNTNVT